MSVRLSSLLAPRQASLVARQLPPRSRSFVASPAFRSPPPPPPAPSSRFQNAFLFLSSPTSSSTAQSQCLSTSAAQSINGVHPPRPDKPDYREMSPQERKKAGEQEAEQSLSTSWNSESPPAYQKKLANGMTEGKLLSTPSRLLKLLLPLRPTSPDRGGDEPLALLVHPHQPLSYLERLIQAELPPIKEKNGATRPPDITFHAAHPGDDSPLPRADKEQKAGNMVRWSAATEIGDFVRDSAKGEKFVVDIEGGADIPINVPSFSDRTFYLRQRLRTLSAEIQSQGKLKEECDELAQRGAQRVAMSGFFALAGWWGAVWWATFHTSLGWDVMEPVTYLAGLTTVILSYLWFLYHNREVSYRSLLHMTVSRRQMKLYAARGFEIEHWEELVQLGKQLKHEIYNIAQEYDVDWDETRDEVGSERVRRALEDKSDRGLREKNHKARDGPEAARDDEPEVMVPRENEELPRENEQLPRRSPDKA